MIIMRSQQPVAIQAGLFGALCLPTFGTVRHVLVTYIKDIQSMNLSYIVIHDYVPKFAGKDQHLSSVYK